MKLRTFAAAFAVTALAHVTAQADETRTERVQFAKGASSATVEGKVKGYDTVDYILGAAKGQYMNVSMATDNRSNYFNIIAPGETDAAMFVGSINGNQYEGTLPASGDYKIRVYLMRNAARREETATYRLEMIISANEAKAGGAGEDSAAARAGQGDFDATGKLPCAQFAGQPMTQCDFGVSRAGGGSATVIVTRPDGSSRALFFEGGIFVSADISQADGNAEAVGTKTNGLHQVTVGAERYEFPDAVIFGG